MRVQQGSRPVLLVTMPWNDLSTPSIQVGILKPLLEREGIRAETLHLNVAFMEFLARHSELSFTLKDYRLINNFLYACGAGEWAFSVPPYSTPTSEGDERYAGYLRERWRPTYGDFDEVWRKLCKVRELVPLFLQEWQEKLLALEPAVVGFSTTFSQNVPSLVLSKLLKQKEPGVKILFGGANCEGPMGAALFRSFPWLDAVVRGEAEGVLVPLVRALLEGSAPPALPGLCFRDGSQELVVDEHVAGQTPVAMRDVQVPDYDEYFERLQRSTLSSELYTNVVRIPFQSARGCWWGAKHHCTFCGLNGQSMTFRDKPADQVFEELLSQAKRYRRLDFTAVDDIISMDYFSALLPRLRDSGFDFKLFYETKANLRREQLELMRDAGIIQFQPGIESLSSSVLKLMRKGVSALQNVRLLKWSAEFNLLPSWSLLYGFPDEPAEEYERMASLVPSLVHLRPPLGVHQVRMDRFSPLYNEASAFRLGAIRPKPFYRFLYPELADEALMELAYFFDFEYLDGREPSQYIAPLKEAVEQWKENWSVMRSLSYTCGPDFLMLSDKRFGTSPRELVLDELEAKIYLACDAGRTPSAVWAHLSEEERGQLSVEEITEFLDELVSERLAYQEGGVYLSLATAESRRAAAVRRAAETAAQPGRKLKAV